MVSYMIKDYIDSFNADDQKSVSPFIVFCSRVDFSLALLQIFRSAQVQNDAWCSRFPTNPNSAALDCDILIVTNVLQAGHSLDTHFKSSYDILFNNVLSFREELQFISCLRYLGRTDDIRAVKNAWIEAGKSNQHIANATKLQQSLSSLYNSDKANYCKGTATCIINRFWSKCFKRIGLKLDTSSGRIPPHISNLAQALCICKALITDDHFIHITSIISPDIIVECNEIWEANMAIDNDR
ncbi:hypothetical protein [Parasitella parasitica]|uniref:Uncharacterized protein n=1 Tax=Parasitella parasitica TaxID=35722 RepID=A0A0B7NWK0_9FUNG|nr:hypothetical protein [Parasitella parasitica]